MTITRIILVVEFTASFQGSSVRRLRLLEAISVIIKIVIWREGVAVIRVVRSAG